MTKITKAINLLNPLKKEERKVIKITHSERTKLQQFEIHLRAYLSMSQKGHICYGTSQCDTQFQNLCYSACITPLLQASLAHMHLVAKHHHKIKHINPKPYSEYEEPT